MSLHRSIRSVRRQPTVVITGASGFLGRTAVEELKRAGAFRVVGVAYRRPGRRFETVDLRSRDAVHDLFRNVRPDFVVHAAGERRAEMIRQVPGDAWSINTEATGHLAGYCAKRRIPILYVSSDYVFDGASPPYFPESPTCPVNAYGSMKKAGEEVVRASGAPYGVLRLSILYGPVEEPAEAPIPHMAIRLARREPMDLDDWVQRYPLHVSDAARAVACILGHMWGIGRTGSVYQVSGPDRMTFYRMAHVVGAALGVSLDTVRRVPTPPTDPPEPHDTAMDRSGIEALGFAVVHRFPGPLLRDVEPHFGSS